MAERTKIEWCDATFNPWLGCTKISPACENCYAERFGHRFGIQWGPGKPRKRTSPANWRQPIRWNLKAQREHDAWEQFEAKNPGLTDAQLQAQGLVKPRRPRVFCASLGDVFGNEVPAQWRVDLLELILKTPHLDWLLLTKRIGNAQQMLDEAIGIMTDGMDGWRECREFEHVWIGATICNQEQADRDIPTLLALPAAKRFLSIEPMLGPIDLDLNQEEPDPDGCYADRRYGIHWVICGGETGPHVRPMHPDWVRSLRNQCEPDGLPFFFKAWGEWFPRSQLEYSPELVLPYDDCVNWSDYPKLRIEPDETWHKVGKKAAGRLLDGKTWDEVPQQDVWQLAEGRE